MNNATKDLAGPLLIVGFAGLEPPASLLQQIAAGEVGGVILFARNIAEPAQVVSLIRNLRQAAPADSPLIVSVDQEGGRVQRLRRPLAEWPPMRRVAERNDPELTFRLGKAIGRDLALLGFNVDFAPVLDVVTSEENSVIGDRSFGSSSEVVIAHGLAFARGLLEEGVLPCGKHFPGHGGPVADSHHTLPVDTRSPTELSELDLKPFAAAAQAKLPLLMSAHVLYPNWDTENPGTLSRTLNTEILRGRIGFEGALISDDMEMGAIAQRMGPGEAALAALLAGVDLLLVCHSPERQAAVREALAQAARSSAQVLDRLEEARSRVGHLKKALSPSKHVVSEEALERTRAEVHRELLEELEN